MKSKINKVNITFQTASEKDSETIAAFLSELYIELGEEKESLDFLNHNLIKTILSSGKTEIFLVLAGEDICGIISLTESQAIYAGGTYGSLDEMYIKPEYRNTGAGKHCIAKIKIIAKEKNWKRIDVTAPTDEKWAKTIDFYKKNGFVFTGPKFKLKI